MNNEEKRDLIKRYINRQLSPEELDRFFNLMQQDGEQYMPEVEDVPAYYEEEPTIDIPGQIIQEQGRGKVRYPIFRRLAVTAASVAAALLIIFSGVKLHRDHEFHKLTQTYTTVDVPMGKVITVTLPDSSLVTLGSGSVLRYPKAFAKGERKVELLEGSAFFDVERDTLNPFRVVSGELQTTALGTSFIVQRYDRYGYEKVNLYTGKVRVDNLIGQGNPVILYPGQEVSNETNKGNSDVRTFDVTVNFVENGTLVFNNTPFNEAIYQISSYYGVDVTFDEEIFQNRKLTGEYNFRRVDEVLRSIAFVHNLKINTVDNHKYSIMPKK